ncbi:uncharacterized protein EKO05_0006680 [Ascochyta rabiei]|uniref:uncharacterized protein n=1 Tax=Didymella rabiei TaxID=5454 RepID=UPI0021FA570E|nr:uncharacterized protein EKO05_0006680 [Ascochyta rabiei]UPX16270.1 hypothetical protein EKO05_0006680 [Ascochyta rabiei]
MVSSHRLNRRETHYHLKILTDTPEWTLAASHPRVSPSSTVSNNYRLPDHKPTPKRRTTKRSSSTSSSLESQTLTAKPSLTTKRSAIRKVTKVRSLKINWSKDIAIQRIAKNLALLCDEVKKLNHEIIRLRSCVSAVSFQQYNDEALKVGASVKEYIHRFLDRSCAARKAEGTKKLGDGGKMFHRNQRLQEKVLR